MSARAACLRRAVAAALLMSVAGLALPAVAQTAAGAPAAPGQNTAMPQGQMPVTRGPGISSPVMPGGAPTPGAAAPTEDIRDIRGPKFIVSAWLIPALVTGVVLLALLGYGLWRWLRRRRQPRALLPFELALQRLEEIRSLMQPAHAREFSIAASDIVRGYIEERFSVTATHRTTEEFLHDLLDTPNASLAKHRALLSDFLNQCDLVKFAGMSLSTQTMETLHASARAFVLETAKPDAAAVPATSAPATTPEAHDSLPAA